MQSRLEANITPSFLLEIQSIALVDSSAMVIAGRNDVNSELLLVYFGR